MNLNIELINGSHFEWLCFQYLLKNFFPEINNILYINYYIITFFNEFSDI